MSNEEIESDGEEGEVEENKIGVKLLNLRRCSLVLIFLLGL